MIFVLCANISYSNNIITIISDSKALMDHGTMVGKELAISYDICCIRVEENLAAHDKVINVGLRLGEFLSDAGWYTESERVLLACKKLSILDEPTPENLCRTLKCCCKYVLTFMCSMLSAVIFSKLNKEYAIHCDV